jgi:hypothetical protein
MTYKGRAMRVLKMKNIRLTVMIKILIVSGVMSSFWPSSGWSEGVGGEVDVQNSLNKSDFTISDGTRISLPEKGLSIVPPTGWEVHRKYPNTTLLLQVPYKKGMEYQRTIQVMRFSGGVPIDDVSGHEFNEIIEQKYSQAEGSISDYRMRNHMVTTMGDSSKGILFYSEFMLQETAIMQAHILVSSADNHYLMTYTDLASHFEGEKASEFLTTAWDSMISSKLESEAPVRMRVPIVFAFAFGFSILMVLLVLSVRKYKAGRGYESIMGEVSGAEEEVSSVETDAEESYHAVTQDAEYLGTESQWNVNPKGEYEDDESHADSENEDGIAS